MKKVMILAAILTASLCSYSQSIKLDSHGNFVQVKDTVKTVDAKPTGKTFTDGTGKVWPVWVSAKGKFFVIRTSQKTGTKYKQYLKIN